MQYQNKVILQLSLVFVWVLSLLSLVLSDTPYNVCADRCRGFSGDAQYKCMQACIYATKRSTPNRNPRTKQRVTHCEAACSHLQGLDNVVCVRKCFEQKESAQKRVLSADPKEDAVTQECENRCAFVKGALKYKCIVKCKKNLKWK